MSFAGKRKSHHGAAMERVFEGDDSGSSSMRARDLHRVLYRFSPTVHEQSLLRKFSGSDLVHPLGKSDIILVRSHLNACVQESIKLVSDSSEYGFPAMSNIEAADATGKVQIAIPVYIFKPGVFGLGHVDWRTNREPAWYSIGAASGERF